MTEPIVLTRYRTKVHAHNRNSDYGIPVDVFATSKREAVDRAIDLGWAGDRRDALVTVLSVEQIHVASLTPEETP